MWKLLSIFFSVLLVARAQFVHDGECRSDVEVVQDFDLDKVKIESPLLTTKKDL